MNCAPKSLALRRYNLRMMYSMAIYIVGAVLTKIILRHHPSQALAITLAFVTSLALVAVIAIVGLYLKEESDEFQRELFIQQLLWASAGTLATTSTWGFVELLSDVPRLPSFYVWVIFWGFFGLVSMPLRLRYRMGNNE
jgi:hypothetical protein